MSALEHVNMTCCYQGCSAIITLHRDEEQRLVRSHEWFYCSNGHKQHFSGKTDEEKKIEQLERRTRQLSREFDMLLSTRYELEGALKECPFKCGYRSRRHTAGSFDSYSVGRLVERIERDMREHLVREHGVPAEHLLEAEKASA